LFAELAEHLAVLASEVERTIGEMTGRDIAALLCTQSMSWNRGAPESSTREL
jgi:hypothetical protein